MSDQKGSKTKMEATKQPTGQKPSSVPTSIEGWFPPGADEKMHDAQFRALKTSSPPPKGKKK